MTESTIYSSPTYRERWLKVMHALGLGAYRSRLHVAADGEAPIVVALPRESVADVMQRVDEFAGVVNLVIAYPRTFTIVQVERATRTSSLAGGVSITPTGTIGFLVEKAKGSFDGLAFDVVFGDAHLGSEQALDYSYA
jgi:hypothetical protein